MATSGLLALTLLLLMTAFHGFARALGPSPSPSMAPVPSSAGEPSMAPGPSSVGGPSMAPGPAASPDCMTILIDNLSQCLTYVEAGSNLTKPEQGCCGGLEVVVNGNPTCLCTLLSASDVYGINISRSRALMLPTVCNVKTPPVSLCSVIGIPVPSPTASMGVPEPSPTASTSGVAPAAGQSGTAAAPPSGNSVDPAFRPSTMALLAALAFAVVGVI